MSLRQSSAQQPLRRRTVSSRVTQTQAPKPLFILSDEEKAFLRTHFEAGYEPLFMKWFLQTSEQKKLLTQKTGAQEFKILPIPALHKQLSDKVLFENEKLRIKNIINSRKLSPKDVDVINDLTLLLKEDEAIVMHAKEHIYECWQDLINLKVMQRF